jgi:hypothetical protein
MSNRTEFFGPMGVGKSTAFRIISKTFTRHSTWVRADVAKARLLAAEKSSSSRLLGGLIELASYSNFLRKHLVSHRFPLAAWHAVDFREYELRLLLQLLGSSEFIPVDPKLSHTIIRYQMFFRDLLDIVLLDSAHCESLNVLFDEGLIQRGIGFSIFKENSKEWLEQFLHLAPLPANAIMLTSPKDVILGRLRSRDGLASKHLDYVEKSIDLVEVASDVLGMKGVKVLKIDSINGKSLADQFYAAFSSK